MKKTLTLIAALILSATSSADITGPVTPLGGGVTVATVLGLFGCSNVATTFLNGAGGCTTPSSTAAAITVGTTTINSGTSGYFLYDNAGVLGNIASTGTGNVVLATSPTLVTPALGTPASGVMTNVTGVPTSALTGALAAAQMPALTGDVTNTAGSLATTVGSYNGGTTFGTFAGQNYATPPAIGGTTPAAGSFSSLTDTALSVAGLVTNTAAGVLGRVAAPAGTVVGTTDTQILTNKTVYLTELSATPITTSNTGTTGLGMAIPATTFTDSTAASGTTATVEAVYAMAAPTIAAPTNTPTFTSAATLYVVPPVAGTNVAITTGYGIYDVGAFGATGGGFWNGSVSLDASSNSPVHIQDGSSTSTTTIGNASSTLTVNAGTVGFAGTVSINASNNAATNIGTGTTTSAVSIGGGSNGVNISSGTTAAVAVKGVVSVNASNNAATNIATGTTTSTVSIANGTGNAAVQIGNGNGKVTIGGVLLSANVNSSQFSVASGTGACATSSTIVGGNQAGSFKCTGTTGASTVTLTLKQATTSYSCWGRDITTPTTVTQTGAVSMTAVTLTLTSVTANDFIEFGCLGY